MIKMLDSLLSLVGSSVELAWLYLQLWALRAEIAGLQLLYWLQTNPDGAIGTACGLAGAWVLAISGRRQALGWALFLASNAGMIALGLRLQRPDIVMLQCGFIITSGLGLWRTGARPWLYWDEWRGDLDGNPTMLIKHLVTFRGRRADLHKIIGADPLNAYHTHPATAIRLVLWNGYVEELESSEKTGRRFRHCRPGHISVVRPETSHRIHFVVRGVSYSLWLRGLKTHKTELRGTGWPEGSEAA